LRETWSKNVHCNSSSQHSDSLTSVSNMTITELKMKRKPQMLHPCYWQPLENCFCFCGSLSYCRWNICLDNSFHSSVFYRRLHSFQQSDEFHHKAFGITEGPD